MKTTLFTPALFLFLAAYAVAEFDQHAIENFKPDSKTLEAVQSAYDKRVTITDKEVKAVSAMSDIIASREFQEQQAALRKEIASAMGVDEWASADGKGKEDKHLPYSSRPIVFASSSVPEATLKNYLADLEKVNGVMVFRGFIGGMGKVMPTMSYMDKLVKKNNKCVKEPCERYKVPVLVDPILFKEYGIKVVPAFAVHGLTNLSAYCNGTEGLNPSKHVVYGDSSIKFLAIKLYENSGDVLHKELSERL